MWSHMVDTLLFGPAGRVSLVRNMARHWDAQVVGSRTHSASRPV
jgi:hypothetical protein